MCCVCMCHVCVCHACACRVCMTRVPCVYAIHESAIYVPCVVFVPCMCVMYVHHVYVCCACACRVCAMYMCVCSVCVCVCVCVYAPAAEIWGVKLAPLVALAYGYRILASLLALLNSLPKSMLLEPSLLSAAGVPPICLDRSCPSCSLSQLPAWASV